MIARIAGIPRNRMTSLVRVLTLRAIRVRYRGSSLGVLWSVSNPLIMTAVYTFVFGRTFSPYYADSKIRYVAALFTGLAVMNFFSTSTFQALQIVVSNGLLLNKMRVPSIVFPVSTVLANSFQLACGTAPMLAIISIVIGRDPLWIPFIIVPLVALVALALGVGLGLSALFVFYRDIPYLYELAYFAIFVTTPVFYPLEIIDPKYRAFIEFNPLSLVVEQLRAVVVFGNTPSLIDTSALLGASAAVFCAGLLAFRFSSPRFMDYL
jgi:ABC-type polysaccharide/polyol phosphate export permease